MAGAGAGGSTPASSAAGGGHGQGIPGLAGGLAPAPLAAHQQPSYQQHQQHQQHQGPSVQASTPFSSTRAESVFLCSQRCRETRRNSLAHLCLYPLPVHFIDPSRMHKMGCALTRPTSLQPSTTHIHQTSQAAMGLISQLASLFPGVALPMGGNQGGVHSGGGMFQPPPGAHGHGLGAAAAAIGYAGHGHAPQYQPQVAPHQQQPQPGGAPAGFGASGAGMAVGGGAQQQTYQQPTPGFGGGSAGGEGAAAGGAQQQQQTYQQQPAPGFGGGSAVGGGAAAGAVRKQPLQQLPAYGLDPDPELLDLQQKFRAYAVAGKKQMVGHLRQLMASVDRMRDSRDGVKMQIGEVYDFFGVGSSFASVSR